MAKKPLFQVLLFAAIIAMLPGCLAPLTATYPPPMLTPAVDFADGVSEVPEGWTLLLEYRSIVECIGCRCGIGHSLAGSYSFDGKRVQGTTTGSANRSRVLIGQFSQRSSSGGLSMIAPAITAVDSLPEARYGGPVLRAVDKQGAVVVEIDGQTFYIYPGGHWARTMEYKGGDCPETHTVTLTNFGLLPNEQIDVVYREGSTSRPFKPGAP